MYCRLLDNGESAEWGWEEAETCLKEEGGCTPHSSLDLLLWGGQIAWGIMPDEPRKIVGHCWTGQHLLSRRRALKYRTLCSEGQLHLIQGFHLLSKTSADIGPASQSFRGMTSPQSRESVICLCFLSAGPHNENSVHLRHWDKNVQEKSHQLSLV